MNNINIVDIINKKRKKQIFTNEEINIWVNDDSKKQWLLYLTKLVNLGI